MINAILTQLRRFWHWTFPGDDDDFWRIENE